MIMHDKKPKKAGKNVKSSIDVSPCLWTISSKTKNIIHKNRTLELIFPNFLIKFFFIYPP